MARRAAAAAASLCAFAVTLIAVCAMAAAQPAPGWTPEPAEPRVGGEPGRPDFPIPLEVPPAAPGTQPLDIRPINLQAAVAAPEPITSVLETRPAARPNPAAAAVRPPREQAAPRQKTPQPPVGHTPPPLRIYTATQAAPETAAPLPKPEKPRPPEPEPAPMPGAPPAEQYCTGIANAAADARFAWQKKVMEDTARDIDSRVAQLQAKIDEYKVWLAKRDEFAKKAHESLISIYARMKPDTAAAQLTELDEETAAAVLTKLNTRAASTIMNDIPPAKAARLSAIIAGAAKVPEPKEAGKDQKPPGGDKTEAPPKPAASDKKS